MSSTPFDLTQKPSYGTTPADPRPSDPLAFNRILSIDIFRGLTMTLMIFVNDLASVHGLPRWNYHAHGFEDRMTYVDAVFPAFLFILGGAIPLAIRRRLQRDASIPHLVGHILLRSFALLVLGLILANSGRGDAAHMHGLPPAPWTLLALLGAVLLWAVYPRSSPRAGLFRAMRLSGLVLLITMFALFRGLSRNGAVTWIDFGYPEILGLLAFTYLTVSLLFLLTRRWPWAPILWLALALALNCAEAAHILNFPDHLSLYVWPFSNGSMILCAMAGLLSTEMLVGALAPRFRSARSRLLATAGFGILLLLAGLLLQPLGISKIRATPTWGLWSSGTSVLLLALLHWLCDLRRHTRWAFFAKPAGTNTLLTYLLPDSLYFAFFLTGFSWSKLGLATGLPGAVRAGFFTGAILAVSAFLTRVGLRLQL